jgi:hypothetical protein
MALNLDLARKKANISKTDEVTAKKSKALRKKFMKAITDIFHSNRHDIEEILVKIGYTDMFLTKLNKLEVKEYPDYFAISFALYRNTKQCFINIRCDDTEAFATISNIGLRIDKKNVHLPTSEEDIIPTAETLVETTVNYIVDIFEDFNTAERKL